MTPSQKELFLKQFAEIESSFRVEGMDPSGEPTYEDTKARILSGELTPQQAVQFIYEQFAAARKPLAIAS